MHEEEEQDRLTAKAVGGPIRPVVDPRVVPARNHGCGGSRDRSWRSCRFLLPFLLAGLGPHRQIAHLRCPTTSSVFPSSLANAQEACPPARTWPRSAVESESGRIWTKGGLVSDALANRRRQGRCQEWLSQKGSSRGGMRLDNPLSTTPLTIPSILERLDSTNLRLFGTQQVGIRVRC